MNGTVTQFRHEARGRRAQPSYSRIVRIMNLIHAEAAFPDLENEIKVDPLICYRLMLGASTSGMIFPREIRSIQQVIAVLGYHQLYNRMAMLLMTADPRDAGSVTGLNAIIRGRFLELIGNTRLSRSDAEGLFVVGAFSLLDQMLGEPMPRLIEPLRLPADMAAALRGSGGAYAGLLQLAEAIEGADEARIEACQQSLGVQGMDIYQAYTAALEWSENPVPAQLAA